MGFKEYIKKLIDDVNKHDVVANHVKTYSIEYKNNTFIHLNSKDKLDRLIEEVFSKLKPEEYIAINKEIFGNEFENKKDLIAHDSNVSHIYEDFKDEVDFFDICDTEKMQLDHSANTDYGNFLIDLDNKFLSTGKSDEELLEDPALLDYLNNLRENHHATFMPRDLIDSYHSKNINFIPVNLDHKPTEAEIAERDRKDIEYLKKALLHARAYKASPKSTTLHPERVGVKLRANYKKYGIKEIETDRYNLMVMDVVDKYVDKNLLDSIADKYQNEKNLSEEMGLETTKKHSLYPKIQEYIKGINDGTILVPEGTDKKELLDSLAYAGEKLTEPTNRAYNYMHDMSTHIDPYNQHSELLETYNGLKSLEGGKYYQLFDKQEKAERDLLEKGLTLTNVGNVVKGKEHLIDEYIKIKPEFSKEYVENLKKIFNKFEEMKMYEFGVVAEEQFKEYSMKRLVQARRNLINAIKTGNLKDVPKAKKEFEKQYKNAEELYALARKTGGSTFPANVGTERNKEVPFEFSSDYKTSSLLNSYYILYKYLKANNITIDQFVLDPAKYIQRDVENMLNTKGINAVPKDMIQKNGLIKGKAKAIAKLNDTSSVQVIKGQAFAVAQSASTRGYLGIVDGEPDETKKTHNLIAMDMANSISGENAVHRDSDALDNVFIDDPDALQNFLLVKEEDIDLRKLKGNSYHDLSGRRVTNPPLNRQKYILDNDITAEGLYKDSLEILAEIPNYDDEDEIVEFKYADSVGKPMLAMMKNFTEYLIAHPEEAKTTYGKKMISFINNPKKIINSRECLKKYTNARYNYDEEIEEEVESLKEAYKEKTKEAKGIKDEYKKRVEDPVKKSEKEFNKIAKNMIQKINTLTEQITNGIDVERNTTKLLKEQNKYKLFAADRTMELLERYKNGTLPIEYVKHRVNDINTMNITNEKIDIFKYNTLKEKLLFEEEYRRRVTSPNPKEHELPKDIEFGDLNMTKIESNDGKLTSDFTKKEQEFINKSFNKDFYNDPERLSEKYFDTLGIINKGPIQNPMVKQVRAQIQIDLEEKGEERKSLPAEKTSQKKLENVKVEEPKGRNSI